MLVGVVREGRGLLCSGPGEGVLAYAALRGRMGGI